MSRKLIIDGNAVYEIDEECMLKKRLEGPETGKTGEKDQRDDRIKNQSENKNDILSKQGGVGMVNARFSTKCSV